VFSEEGIATNGQMNQLIKIPIKNKNSIILFLTNVVIFNNLICQNNLSYAHFDSMLNFWNLNNDF